MVDFTKLETIARKRVQEDEGRRNNRLVAILTNVERRLEINPNDDIVEGFEILLGVKQGDRDAALKLIGVEADTTSTDEPAAIMGPNRGILPAFNADGTPSGTGFGLSPGELERAHQAGYTEMLDPDNGVVGWIPAVSAVITAPPASTATQSQDTKVPIRDKRDKKTREEITIREGRLDDGLEAILDAAGNVECFRQKPRLVAPRRRS